MKVLDLFSGIGGFSLGLERAGMKTVAFCEIEDYPVSILKKHWPDIPVHRDIRKLDGRQYYNKIDLLCGGFPCQPYSIAGKQKGKEDDRHLWPEMLRIVKESKPTWVIGENVAGFINMALDDVLFDLEAEGYATQSFVIPACAVGGIHRRDRVWIIAYSERKQDYKVRGNSQFKRSGVERENETPQQNHREANNDSFGRCSGVSPHAKFDGFSPAPITGSQQEIIRGSSEGKDQAIEFKGVCTSSNVADPLRSRLEGFTRNEQEQGERQNQTGSASPPSFSRDWQPIGLPVEPAIRHRDDGFSDNVARLKALGNAVVPQIVEQIGRAIIKVST